MSSKYKGLLLGSRQGEAVWRAQIGAAGRIWHLGTYDTPEEAARAFDNAAYHLRQAGFYRGQGLNFPQDYERDSTPPASSDTERVLSQIERSGTQRRVYGRGPEVDRLPERFESPAEARKAAVNLLATVEAALASARPALANLERAAEAARGVLRVLDYDSPENKAKRAHQEWLNTLTPERRAEVEQLLAQTATSDASPTPQS